MRRNKPIVLVAMVFILSSTAIFSNAEQGKRRRITTADHQDIYSKNKFRSRRLRYNQQPHLFPSRDNRPRYVPGEIIVKFNMPLSDFEVANLIGEYQNKKIGDWRSSWPSARRMLNGSYVIRFPENCSVEQMVQVLKRNPYVKYAEPNFIAYITAYRSTQMIPNPPWEYGKPKPISEVGGESFSMGIELTPRVGDTKRFPKALKKEDMLPKDIHGETNLVLDAYNVGQEAVKKYNGIQPYPETNDNMRETQSSDNKPIIRSKAKIYKYRNSEGRLVITNYYLYKSNTNKQ